MHLEATCGTIRGKPNKESKLLYTLRKFNGDDIYSWAVFKKEDLPKGHRGIVFWGEAKPVVNGCSRAQANHYKQRLEERAATGIPAAIERR
tara:strand:- start:943 stop:1215 length:273 start_codon:yes stop_codon:yes gene_type:complete